MTETRVARVTGIGALMCVALSWHSSESHRPCTTARVTLAPVVWLAVTLVADGLMGGAALDTLRGDADASAVRALVMGTMLIYNGSIAFAITGLFLLSTVGHRQRRPRWTGWVHTSRQRCV